MSLGWSNLEECFTSPLTYQSNGGSQTTNWTDIDKTRVGASAMSQTQQVQQQAPSTLSHQLPSLSHQEHSLPSGVDLPFDQNPSEETYRRDIVLGEITHPKPTPPEVVAPIEIKKPRIMLQQPPDPLHFHHAVKQPPQPPRYDQINQHVDDIKSRLVTVENIIKQRPHQKEHDNYWMLVLLVFIAVFLLMACHKK
jgi:hypothetical protein